MKVIEVYERPAHLNINPQILNISVPSIKKKVGKIYLYCCYFNVFYLAVLSLSCSTQDLHCPVQDL